MVELASSVLSTQRAGNAKPHTEISFWQTPRVRTTFTVVSRILTGFLVGYFVFTPTEKVTSKTFKEQTTLMLFVLNCYDLLWHKHLV